MTKRSAAKAAAPMHATAAPTRRASAFSFGDATPVMGRAGVLDHMECWRAGRYYTPPVDLNGLARTRWASPHHGSAMSIKLNMLVEHFIPHPLLSRQTFEAVALDFIVLANGYVERIDNRLNTPMRLERPLARFVRRGVKPGEFFQLNHDAGTGLLREHAFAPGSVLQLTPPDLNQEIYGVPDWLGALQSTFLNESATIFRRRYYENGSHAGFILYATDEGLEDDDVDTLRTALKESKGPGNFRNVFMYAPNGKKDGLQLIPISEVAAKDEFLGIKNTSRDDVLAAHRVPPQLLGIVPANAGGFGDVAKAADVFFYQEIRPLMTRFLPINDWLGQEVVRFKDYEPRSTGATPAA